MRVPVSFVLGSLFALLALSACSATGSVPGLGDGDGDGGFCRVAQRLPEAAELVQDAPIDDPVAWDEAFTRALDDYVLTLEDLANRAPVDLERDIKLLMSAVEQYKFADAITAAQPLRVYISENCLDPTATTS
jgi:hypothetical protein